MKRLKYIFSIALMVLCAAFAMPAQAQDKVLTAIGAPGQVEFDVPSGVKTLYYTNAASAKKVVVKTNSVARLSTGEKWITPTLEGDTLSVAVSENTGSDTRSGEINIAVPDGNSYKIAVVQLGTAPGFFIACDTVKVSGINAGVSVEITANAEIAFTTAEWISATDTKFENGTKSYVFNAGKMDEGTRYGEIGVTLVSNPDFTGKVTVAQTFEGFPSFIVISDLHFGTDGAESRVQESLATLYENSGDVDAIFVNGDYSNNGNQSNYTSLNSVFGNTDIVPDYIPRYYIVGNHEWYTNDGGTTMGYYNTLGCSFNNYFEIKGYPFIYIGLSGTSEESYSTESLAFLKNSLEDAVEKYPGKPIFVFQHIPAYGTVQGTGDNDGGWGSKKIYNILKDYPQVVDFSGHTHFSSRNPLTLHQDKFTSINDGGNYDVYTHEGIDADGSHPSNARINEGMIVSVESEDLFTITRIDGQRNEMIGDLLSFESPYDGTNFAYANYNGSKPAFEDGAEVTTSEMQTTQRKITFPQAEIGEDLNDIVYYYKVDIVNSSDEVVATANRCSQFYLGSEKPETLSILISGIDNEGTMRARVTAVDPYGNESDPIESEPFTIGEYTPAEGTTLPTADLFDLQVDEKGNGSDQSPMNNVVITSTTIPIAFYDADYKLAGAKFNHDNSQYYAVDYSNNDKIKNALQTAYTMEAFFMCNAVDAQQTPISSQQAGGSGFWMPGEGNGEFHIEAGHGDGEWYQLSSSTNIQPGKYYHAVATYDGEKLRMYLNGYPAGEMDCPDALTLPAEGAHYLVLGGDVSENLLSAGSQAPLDGYLLIARMYSKAVSRDEAYLLYQDAIKGYEKAEEDTSIAEVAPVADLFDIVFGENGTATDVSEQNIDVTVGPTTPTTYFNETYNRWVAQFPGDNTQCYFGVPYSENQTILDALVGDFTLESTFMVNNDNLSSLPAVVSSQQNGGVGIEPGNEIQAWGYFSGRYATAYAYDYPVQKNTYYHVAVVVQTIDVETPTMSLYVNGNLASRVQLAGQMGLPQGNARYFCIGGDASYGGNSAEYLLNGEVVTARLYSRAITGPEVKRLYVDMTKTAESDAE